MKRAIYIGLLILVALVALMAGMFGAFNRFPSAALQAVTNDPKLALYSIDPSEGPARSGDTPVFRDYPILGQTVLTGPSDRVLVADSLRRAARGAWDRAACFNPRHGIRATNSSGTYDILLCFECIQAVVYFPDGHEESIPIHGPSTTLNELLAAANIPLARQP
ncbi:MAG TPA: hypothetical protein VFD27_17465 [Chthoniobacteraceae bacterium]|nr:hypothetical protein [Chthoniobacteraceae bacterium]